MNQAANHFQSVKKKNCERIKVASQQQKNESLEYARENVSAQSVKVRNIRQKTTI